MNDIFYDTQKLDQFSITIVQKGEYLSALLFEEPIGIEGEQQKTPLLERAFLQLRQYFAGAREIFDLPLAAEGTEFQKRVWAVLCTIPYGETRTYKEIAALLGNHKASRAVGMANHNNPLSIIIPCHRVIGSSGKLVGYAGGLDKKEELLQLEKNKKLYGCTNKSGHDNIP